VQPTSEQGPGQNPMAHGANSVLTHLTLAPGGVVLDGTPIRCPEFRPWISLWASRSRWTRNVVKAHLAEDISIWPVAPLGDR
jgi:hypothetical protein